MRSFRPCLILTLAALPHVSYAADLIVDSLLTIDSPATYENVFVTGTGQLTVDAPLTVNVNMTIQSAGVVTHSARLLGGLQLSVTGTLDVQAGGLIDVDVKGLRGGGAGSAFGVSGEAFDPTTGAIISGAVGGSGSGAG